MLQNNSAFLNIVRQQKRIWQAQERYQQRIITAMPPGPSNIEANGCANTPLVILKASIILKPVFCVSQKTAEPTGLEPAISRPCCLSDRPLH
jgi:hypothetical protein